MKTILYDGTFEGFLTVIFELYNRKIEPYSIVREELYQPHMFSDVETISTDNGKSQRVWKGLCRKLSMDGQKIIYYVYLSEINGIELTIYRFIRKVFASEKSIEQDFGDEVVLKMWNLGKKVARESHRILMFVRFQKTLDGLYYAVFDPQYNVLPLSIEHFRKRFADQKWVLYDTRRNYGFYYDLKEVSEIQFTDSRIDSKTGRVNESLLDEDELPFQKLWKIYFKEMEIKERHNFKLHRQHMPKRFWKYLIEKQ
jgi:probable DNA metabolism protein